MPTRFKASRGKNASVHVTWMPEKYDAEMRRLAARHGEIVGNFIVGKVKQVLSVGAPSVRLTEAGRIVATTPATRGAPPRLVSGRLRNSIRHEVRVGRDRVTVRLIAATVYARILELGDPERGIAPHPYLRNTVYRNAKQIIKLFGHSRRKRSGRVRGGRKR